MPQDTLARAAQILRENTGSDSYYTIALIDEDGYPSASSISLSHAEGIKTLYFAVGLSGNRAKRLHACNRASICFNADGKNNITLVGTARILTDAQSRHDTWYAGMEHHFPGGENDADYCVLEFTTQRYSLFVDYRQTYGRL